MVDVGDDVLLTLTARTWPAPASVSVSFLSTHHGFTGPMVWDPSCACFRATVQLARRVHSIERARAVATIHTAGRVLRVATTFLIRGLAPGGKSLAEGAAAILTAWVGDPSPFTGQTEHFCGWLHTLDGHGIPGTRIHFAVHYPDHTRYWQTAPTPSSGVSCVHAVIPAILSGIPVAVDVQAGKLRAHAQFTSRD